MRAAQQLFTGASMSVDLEATTPRGVDLDDVRAHLLQTPGVLDVHDLHAWPITSGLPVLSAHVVIDDDALRDGHGGRVLDRLGSCLSGHFDVQHSAGHRDHEHPAYH